MEKDNSSRRAFLKRTAAGAPVLVGVPNVNQIGVDRRDRIVIARHGNDAIDTRKVPKRWLAHVDQAEAQAEALRQDLGNDARVAKIGVEQADGMIGGRSKLRPKVTVKNGVSAQSFRSENNLFGSERSIKPIVSSQENVELYDCYDSVNNNLKGGIQIGCETEDNLIVKGSMCCSVEYNNSSYMLTVRHSFGDTSWNSNDALCNYSYGDGNAVAQPAGTNGIGTVHSTFRSHDAAIIDVTDGNRSITDDIVNEGGSITGHLSKSGLSYYVGDSVSFRGTKSCSVSPTLTGYDNTYSCNYGGVVDLVETDRPSNFPQEGDSGGILYKEPDNRNEDYVIGLLSHGDSNNASFPAAYGLNDSYSITFPA